jgi:hypothetical protein
MSALEYSRLVYRGNYELTVGVSYENSHLRAEFGGGLSDTEVIFPGLMYARLNYSALSRRVNVQPPNAEPLDRLLYIWNFYRESMDAGRRPFLMRVPPPLPEKFYLWEFAETNLELNAVDRFLATTGLSVKQVIVRGVSTLEDGSVGDEFINPSTI